MAAFISILLGGGILGFVQFLISRYDSKEKEDDEVLKIVQETEKKVEELCDFINEREAVLARTHILRFDDEIYNEVKHTKEYFDQTLEDIDNYNKYCESHPDFKNQRTVMAAQHIIDAYDKVYKKHKFL